jgi:hypothetical protein
LTGGVRERDDSRTLDKTGPLEDPRSGAERAVFAGGEE